MLGHGSTDRADGSFVPFARGPPREAHPLHRRAAHASRAPHAPPTGVARVASRRVARLADIARLFLRLGLTTFGGPAAHVAILELEVVERRKWVTPREFLDLVAATSFIPGPNSTELAMLLGHRRAGFRGLVVAGGSFLLPAVVLTSALAWAYVRFGALPVTEAVLYGVKPVIVAVILQALWTLGKVALRRRLHVVLAVLAAGANLLGAGEILVLFGVGLVAALAPSGSRADPEESAEGPSSAAFLAVPTTAMVAGASSSGLFLVFLKIGSVLFGSGYVLVAFLRAELVQKLHWMTEAGLLDAVAAGQITPGPVFSTATFVGYVVGGASGAIAATAGIFLPAFVFSALSGPLVPRLRQSRWSSGFLDGLNVASLALMAIAALGFGRAAVVDPWTLGLLVASGALLVRFQVSSMWLILGGGVLGNLVR